MAKSALQLEVEGLKELQRGTMMIIKDLHGDEIFDAMRDSTLKIQRRVMRGPPGGRGAPGSTPAGYIPVDTGRLRASISPIVQAYGPVVRGIVGTNIEYGPYHEFGTRRGIRALKYMRASLEETRQWIYDRFDRAMKRIVKRKP